jgi:Uma2 family endonuclease
MQASAKQESHYTYADYLTWPDDERWELIGGVPYAMSAPQTRHQSISRNLTWLLQNFLQGKPCKLFYAPFDVRLCAEDEDDSDTVVQPDVVVVCDPSKLDDKGCKGVPDFIVEILSPGSLRHDRWTKYNLYQRAGVREYWIVDPDAQTIQTHLLEGGAYAMRIYGDADSVPVTILPGCEVGLTDIFAE